MNVEATTTTLDTSYYLLASVRAVVDAGQLRTFAVTGDEIAFMKANNVSTVYNPLFGVDDSGYNSGNYLNCLCEYWCYCVVLMNLLVLLLWLF
jgi:hypothetical protein